MKNFRIIVAFSCLLSSINLLPSIHKKELKLRSKIVMQRQHDAQVIQGLAYIALLLAPGSWHHVVTIPYQQQLPQMYDDHFNYETDAEKFVTNFVSSKVDSRRKYKKPIVKIPSHR